MSNTISRALAAVAVAGLATLSAAAPAFANDTPTHDCATYPESQGCQEVVNTQLTDEEAAKVLSDTTVVPGQLVTVTGVPPEGREPFAPNTETEATWESHPVFLGAYTANSAGRVSFTFRVPADATPGQHHVVVAGAAADGAVLVYGVPITVVGDGGAGTGGLPFTGAEIGVASLAGATALGAGTLLVVAGRKRKSAAATV